MAVMKLSSHEIKVFNSTTNQCYCCATMQARTWQHINIYNSIVECSRGVLIVERWVRGEAAQIGCLFGLPGLPMAPFLFENWFRYRLHFSKMLNFL